jgi:hypothetical protein
VLSFKSYLNEQQAGVAIRAATIGLTLKIKNLEALIQSEKNPKVKLELLAKQNTLNSYLAVLNLAIASDDRTLLRRVRSKKS